MVTIYIYMEIQEKEKNKGLDRQVYHLHGFVKMPKTFITCAGYHRRSEKILIPFLAPSIILGMVCF
jgi:hypothetical protein